MNILFYDALTPELIAKWQKLWQASPYANFTNSVEWFIAADETYKYTKKKIVALFSDTNRLIGICGLVEEKISGVPVWTYAAREFADKQALLLNFDHPKEVKQFLSALSSLCFVFLINIPQQFITHFAKKKEVTTLFSDLNSYIDFTQGPYGNMKNQRANHIFNKIKKDGHILKMEADVADKHKALETVFAIENNSSKLANGKAVFDNSLTQTFYTKLVEHKPENVVITLIWIDETPIAYSISFTNKASMQGSQKAHMPAYKMYSPGRLIVMSLCDYAKEKGQAYFDLGRGVDEFKRSFITRTEQTYFVFIAKNAMLRSYFQSLFYTRSKVYDKLVQFQKLYKLYRAVMKGFIRHGN